MIISVRGTHGSGKSTIVKQIISKFPQSEELKRMARRRPIGYKLFHPARERPLVVPGHYETPSGGCDNISSVEEAYGVVRKAAHEESDVLLEGILAQHYAVDKFVKLRQFGVVVIVLTTPLEQCITDVLSRRGETTPERAEKITQTIIREFRNVRLGAIRLRDRGIKVHYLTREETLTLCLQLLEINEQ